MERKDTLLGQRFNHAHAAGVTRFQVDRKHRDVGYYECVAVRAVSGTHHFIGGINVFSRAEVLARLDNEAQDDDCREAQDNTPSLGPFGR